MTARVAIVTSFRNGDDWKEIFRQNPIECFAGQREICPTTGNWHWHFFIRFNQAKRKTAFQKYINDDVANVKFKTDTDGWDEQRMYNYCQKAESYVEGTRFKFGVLSKQGKRSDLQQACDEVLRTGDLECLIEENPQMIVKYHKGFEKLIAIGRTSTKRTWEMDVRIYWGKSGTGKTRKVYDEFGFDKVYCKPCDNKWWDGYKGQEVVLLDEFDPITNHEYFSINLMKRLLDRYPMEVEVKGGTLNFCSDTIIITSNKCPGKWYEGYDAEDVAAIKRRFKTIIHMT